MKPYVVKQSKGRAILLGLAVLVFTVAGVFMLASDDMTTVLMGVAAIGFFGVGGTFALIKMFRQGNTLVADERGIHPANGGFVPWEHIGEIAPTTTGGASALGIAISDVPAYLASLTPEQRDQTFQWAKGMAGAMRPIAGAAGQPSPELESLGDADDLDGMMAWARQMSGGYDLTFASMTLGKSVEKTAADLNEYRHDVLRRRGV